MLRNNVYMLEKHIYNWLQILLCRVLIKISTYLKQFDICQETFWEWEAFVLILYFIEKHASSNYHQPPLYDDNWTQSEKNNLDLYKRIEIPLYTVTHYWRPYSVSLMFNTSYISWDSSYSLDHQTCRLYLTRLQH